MASSTSSLLSAAAIIRANTFVTRCPRMNKALPALALLLCVAALGTESPDAPDTASASLPDPYRQVDNFLKMPAGRPMGSSSAIATDHDGNIWVADRCGANNCAGSELDPIMEVDARGNFIKAFGKGILLFPHGFFIDGANHIWVTDGHVDAGKGDDVLEF